MLTTVAIGLRLAIGGARRSWARIALVAAGVGVGVALLLTGLAVGPALEARDARERAREPVGPGSPPRTGSYVLQAASIDVYRGQRLLRLRVAAVGESPPLPPGLDELPRPGEAVVSPALARLLGSPEGALLRPRLPGRIVSVIGKQGLAWPDELLAYSGVKRAAATEAARFIPVVSYGHPEASRRELPAEIKLVVLIAVIGLLLPTLAFIAASSRVAAAARARRLAAIRLLGATPAQTRMLAAVESLPAAVLGCLVGIALFLALRPFAPALAPAGHEFFAVDLTPPLGQLLVVLAAVPLLAVVASLIVLRRVELSPLGIVRRGRVRRVGAIRALPLGLGFALLGLAWFARGDDADLDRDEELIRLLLGASGFALVLVGVITVVPWLTVLAARMLARRAQGISTLLTARRLLLEPTTAARLVSGAVVAVFVATVAHAFLPPLGAAAESQTDVVADARPGTLFVGTGAAPDELLAPLRAVPGVVAVASLGAVSAIDPKSVLGRSDLLIADCAALNRVLARPLPSCSRADGYRFKPHPPYAPSVQPGGEVRVLVEPDRTQETVPLRVPAALTPVPARSLFGDDVALLLPPSAVPRRAELYTRLGLIATDGSADTAERVRNALAGAGVEADVATGAEYLSGQQPDEIRGVIGLIDLATLLILAIAAAGLLVASVDSVLERRRPLAILAAAGTPKSVLRRAVLLESAVPLVCGLAVAAASALLTAALILAVNGEATVLPVGPLAAFAGAAIAAVLMVVALTLPTLSGAIRPEALRAE